jgi:WD40 repeat protein
MDQHPHNSDLIYTGNENGIIQCIDLRMNQNTLMSTQLYSHKHNAEVCKVKICPKTANTLISGGNDNKGIVYDLRKNTKIMEIKHNAAIKGIAINKEGNKFVTGGGTYDKMIKLWDLKKQTLISETLTDSQITNIEFIDNDQILVSFGYIGNNMVLYKLNYDQLKEESMNSVNLSNMKLGFESEGDDVIDIFKPEMQFEPHHKRILFMAKAKLGEYVSTASNDGVVKIWKTNKYIKSFNGFDLFNNNDVR